MRRANEAALTGSVEVTAPVTLALATFDAVRV